MTLDQPEDYLIKKYFQYGLLCGVGLTAFAAIDHFRNYFNSLPNSSVDITTQLAAGIFDVILTVFILFLFFMFRRGSIRQSILLSVILGVGAITIHTLFLDRSFFQSVFFFIFVLLIIVSAFFEGYGLTLVTLISILVITLGFLISHIDSQPREFEPPSILSLILILLAIIISALFLRVTILRERRRSRIMQHKTAELELYKNRLEELVNQRTQELIIEKNKAEEANAIKSQFLAKMSHELRTPLNAIIGYSEMISEEANDIDGCAEIEYDAKRIGKAGNHLLVLINDILDLSKIEAEKISFHLTDIHVGHLIQEIADVIRPIITLAGNQLHIVQPSESFYIYSDPARLRQILINLLSNASKFTEGGTITFSASTVTDDDQQVASFSVRDTGIGIDEEAFVDLFEPFSQIDNTITRNHQGSGLGLPIAKHLCEKLGGTLTVESQPEVGSTFTVTMPLVRVPSAETA
ncbi:MAG: ATP-binding protein [Chloroflexota bacterium]